MPREIKFRAWYKLLAQMVESDKLESINFDTKTLGVYMAHEGRGFHKLRMSDFVLMQFTGLKDRNGKEIYEGDILSGYNGGYLFVIQYFQPDCRYIAVNAEDYATGKWDDADEAIGLVWVACEVIGNVWEHPHILEGGTTA